ncbi:MAG: VWA domain-containing protein [Bryobacteraceae bacterium]|nr:VWA domain-containing protein [Bryobacteraceae bacterium]
MTRRQWLALAASAASSHGQDPTFKVDVRLVRLLVTVKDQRGAPVGGLTRDDFRVQDNGIPQELALFEKHTEQPLSVALLMDASASTGKELKFQLDSARKFLSAIFAEGNPDDAVSFYTFNYEVTQAVRFSRRLSRFESAMKAIKPEGGTSLYDALFVAAEDLEPRGGRHVIVVVTDGGDTTSVKKFPDALRAVHLADAAIYTILVVPVPTDAGRNTGGENALETLSSQTGGRVFAPTIGDPLDRAFADILADLRTQYLLGFYPRNVPRTKDPFHRLAVNVARPGLRVVSRTGYFGEADPQEPAPGRGPLRSQ